MLKQGQRLVKPMRLPKGTSLPQFRHIHPQPRDDLHWRTLPGMTHSPEQTRLGSPHKSNSHSMAMAWTYRQPVICNHSCLARTTVGAAPRLEFFLVRPLSSYQIAIQLRNVLEDRHIWKRFDNFKHFLDLRLQVNK